MEPSADQFNSSQLINDFKVVIADAEALLQATANSGGEKLVELRAKVEESLSTAKTRMVDAQDEVLAKTKEAVKATDEYVHENPWQSIGIAASVGVVIGLLIGRR